MDIATLTASIAGICMALCQAPQAWKIYRTRQTNGISILMQLTLTMGVLMWFTTGILLANVPMWLSNGVCLVFCLYVLTMCIINKNKK